MKVVGLSQRDAWAATTTTSYAPRRKQKAEMNASGPYFMLHMYLRR